MGRRQLRPMPDRPDREESDAALIAGTATGDLAAFERLHRRFYARIFRFALRLSGRPEIADEVVGDTMLAVWRGAARFEGRARPSSWLFGIAYRIAMRAMGREPGADEREELDEAMPAPRTGVQEVEALFERRRIVVALAQLPPEQRATVELTYFHGYRLSEIAEITGCPPGTVKSRMFLARARLRVLLEEPDCGKGGR